MEEINLKELIMFFWKKKILIALVIILFAGFGVLYTRFGITPNYESSVTLILVETKFETEAEITAYYKLLDMYKVIANSKKVVGKVIDNLKLDMEIVDLQKKIYITTSSNSQMLKIKIANTNPEMAANIANELAKVFLEEINEIYGENRLKILDPAIVMDTPTNISMTKNVLIFSVVGIVLICMYVLLIFLFKEDTNKEKIDEIENKYLVVKEKFLKDLNKNEKYLIIINKNNDLEKKINELNNSEFLKMYNEIKNNEAELKNYYIRDAYIKGAVDFINNK